MTPRYEEAPVWFGYSGVKPAKKPLKECVIVDLDGTLMNNEHRQHFMRGDNKRWASFFDAMRWDTPHEEIKWIVSLIFKHTDKAVMLCTGRPTQYHGMTLQSLIEHNISYTALIMRAQKDNRPDTLVKLDMLKGIVDMGYRPILSIDDRPEVVQMWRNEGLRTLQCDPGPWRDHVISTSLMEKLQLRDENERLQMRVEELERENTLLAHRDMLRTP